MDGNVSGEESASVDWTTDDELDLAETVTSSQPTLTTCREAIPCNGEDIIELLTSNVLYSFSSSICMIAIEQATASSSAGVSRFKLLINHFVGMGFSEKMVSKAIEENGEGDTEAILNTLLTYSTLEESPQQPLSMNSDPSSSDYNETFLDDFSDVDSWSENEIEVKTESMSEKHKMLLALESSGSLSEEEEKLLALANMGYSVEEASIAMQRCGPEASVTVLTDFICAAQMAREEDCYLPEDVKPKHIYDGNSKKKKRKFLEMQKRTNVVEETIRPPYFYYENVALAPKGVWDTISRFLYEIEPEFVDSKYFSATARKRGYVHNLPIQNRFPLIPQPPLTIQQAFPLSRKWWPSWDPRDKLNCIQTAIASAKLTERIRTALERYEGDPPESVQRYVLEQCRKWNLVWVGRNKLAPLEPDEIEMLLGFPKNHTRGGGISRTDRYKSLGNSFQVDTVAYHLSVLKDIFPNGINVLSLFSGIGGAEVALHRLGIKLKNVVSIEKSKVNRDIVRSWWEQTNQPGNLIDFDDVRLFEGERVEQIINSIGGFDLVVGGSPCNNLAGSNRVSRDGLEGKESSLFYDYFRILDLVRCIMRNRQM
ncbi:hypothetical protein DH2020_012712 [Rehmannia glutinosa]|uniref:DNA (cytosine-5-)-methyltransferase n=1 Tax=Rehmannia glutinosa TaxID=99300 RepID=A0ABR0X051_REHGL